MKINIEYQILGKVKSLNFNNTGKEKELKQKVNRYGYMEVKLSKNNKTKDFLVATLVANAFIPNKNPDKIVCHISENVADNNVGNLKWCYKSEMLHNTYKRKRRYGAPSQNTISYKGIPAKTLAELFRELGVEYNLTRKRLDKGWTLEEAIEIPKNAISRGTHNLYEYNGEYLTLRQLAEKYDMNYDLIRKRISKGWSIYEAVGVPKLK